MKPRDTALERKGLPSNVDAEKLVLGQVLLDGRRFEDIAAKLAFSSFSDPRHQAVWLAMLQMHEKKTRIDRVTVAKHLGRRGELDKVDGLTYLLSLDEGMPNIPNLDEYVNIVHEKSNLRRVIYFARNIEQQVLLGQSDFSKILTNAELDLVQMSRAAVDDDHGDIQSTRQVMENYPGGVNAFLSPHLGPRGLSLGLPRLDKRLHYLDEDDLLVIAGPPSGGKSALSTNIMAHIASEHGPAFMFSLEMTKNENVRRQICARAGVGFSKFKRGAIDVDERRKINKEALRLADAPMYFDETTGLTMHDIYTRSRMMVRKKGVKCIAIDYLQIMSTHQSGTGIRFGTPNEALEYICNNIKSMGKKLKIPVILLSQFSRAATKRGKEDARPKLSDLANSSAIEKAATKVVMIYRPELDNPKDSAVRGVAELIVRKNRNGPLGTIMTRFEKQTMRFIEVVPDEADYDDED